MADRILYEFVTPSDPITFYAPDDDIAEAVGIFVGNGKAGVNAAGKEKSINTLVALVGWVDGQEERFTKTMNERTDEVLAAAHTFAVASIADRPIYDDYTNNGQDKDKVDKWDDTRRSSMSNWCGYARNLKLKEKHNGKEEDQKEKSPRRKGEGQEGSQEENGQA